MRKAFVLVVDDEPAVLRIVAQILQKSGHSVSAVPDGYKALALLDQHIDLLITDVVMPGRMDGIALAKAVSKLRPQIPIILMSGFSSGRDRAENTSWQFIPKPFSMWDLLDAVNTALSRSQRSER